MECAVVIHTEEEFDWNGGFNRFNDNVSHHTQFTTTVKQLVDIGAKVTLALDYAFINSPQGRQAIEELVGLASPNIEFASHLHPWVTPPFSESDSEGNVDEYHSFAGNLARDLEFAKLKTLTDAIEALTHHAPTTYLAGRYGIGKNTYEILHALGYKTDISPSAFSDFTSIGGPDFSSTTNGHYIKQGIEVFPHSSAFLSVVAPLANYLNKKPELFARIQSSPPLKLLGKIARLKKLRFSPEGVPIYELKRIYSRLQQTGHQHLILSLHSSSLKSGLTPYSTGNTAADIGESTVEIMTWLLNNNKVIPSLVSEFSRLEKANND